jgi:hypothetical protein
VVPSNLQEGGNAESVEEFALTNFTGRLVIKRRNNRAAVVVREELSTLASLPPRLMSAMKRSMPAASAAKSTEKQESVRFDDDSSYQSAKEDNGIMEETGQSSSSIVEQLHASAVANESSPSLKVGPGSRLHTRCSAPSTTLQELRSCLDDYPNAPFERNADGQTPLFLLTTNSTLWNSSTDAHIFAMELVNINPAAVAMTDCEDQWPCFSIITKWVEDQYAEIDQREGNMLTNVLRSVGTAVTNTTARNAFSTSMLGSSSRPRRNNFPRAHLNPGVESALALLSLSFISPTTTQELSHVHQLELRKLVCNRVAVGIPNLLATLFLLEPESVRRRVFDLPFIRRFILEPATVGPWLVTMVRRKGLPSKRAVDYFELLSQSDLVHFLPGVTFDIDIDEEGQEENVCLKAYEESKTDVLNTIGDMGSLIPSLFVLEEREMNRATSVSALWRIMQHVLRRPFIIGIVMIDFVLHLTLSKCCLRSDAMLGILLLLLTLFTYFQCCPFDLPLWLPRREFLSACHRGS